MDGTVDFLLVEDDREDAHLILNELERGHLADKLMVVHDGEEALDFIFCRGAYSHRSPTHPPKVVVTDLKLPKIDGMQVLEEIKSKPETRAIPVVMFSSSGEERDIARSYRLGVNSYIQKPMDIDHLEDLVRTLGRYWLMVNQPPTGKAFAPENRKQE